MPQRPVVLLTNCWLCLGNKSDREAVTRLCDVIWDMGDVCTTVSWTLAVMGTRGYFCLVYEDEAFMMSFLSHTGGAALKPNTMCSIYRQRCVFFWKHSKHVGDRPWASSRDAAQLTSFHRVIKTRKESCGTFCARRSLIVAMQTETRTSFSQRSSHNPTSSVCVFPVTARGGRQKFWFPQA